MTKFSGNIVPEVTAKEHDEILAAKRISLISAATINAVVNTSAGQASTVLDTGANWIGLATVQVGAALPAGDNNIGNVDIVGGTITTITNDVNIADGGNVISVDDAGATLSIDDGGGAITVDGTVAVSSIAAGDNNIGNVDIVTAPELTALATVTDVNPYTMSHVAIAANSSGYATIFVPTNTFKATHFVLSANATVGVRILSGATYLIGNASLNMTLFPGGGIVENGQVGNPVYTGATAADSFVIDLDDSVEVAGKVVYYEE